MDRESRVRRGEDMLVVGIANVARIDVWVVVMGVDVRMSLDMLCLFVQVRRGLATSLAAQEHSMTALFSSLSVR